MRVSRSFQNISFVCVSAFALFSPQAPALAQTVTGTIDASITLAAACQVNGSTDTINADFGALAFGSQTTLFTDAAAQVNGAGGIAIQCSPGADATLTIVGGSHDAASPAAGRAMSNAGGTLFVPYEIYSNPGMTTVLANAGTLPVTADGTIQNIAIYGKALGTPGLTPGLYTDTINVTLTF